MYRTLLLGIALLSFAAVAEASDGTVQFSGRVVDPGCRTLFAPIQRQLQIEQCPDSAQGAKVSFTSMDTGTALSLRNGSNSSQQITLMAPATQRHAPSFSQRLHLDAQTSQVMQGSYLIDIDYL